MLLHAGGGQIWKHLRVVIINILLFAVMDALNCCSWCGRVEWKIKVMRRRVAVLE